MGQTVAAYVDSHNYERPHQALDYLTPADLYLTTMNGLTNGTNVNER